MSDKPDAGEAARRIVLEQADADRRGVCPPWSAYHVDVAHAYLSSSKRIEELEKAVQKLWMTAVLVSDNELAVAQDALETIQATLRHRQQPQDVTFHRGLHALRDAREVLAKLKDPTP